YRNLSNEEKEDYNQAMTKDTFYSRKYTIFRIENGQIKDSKTWAQAFRADIKLLCGFFNYIVKEKSIAPEIANYFKALMQAYSCEDRKQLRALWLVVDEAWSKIPKDSQFIPLHCFCFKENSEHPYCVAPEFHLAFLDESTTFNQHVEVFIRSIWENAKKINNISDKTFAKIQKSILVTKVKILFQSGSWSDTYAAKIIPERRQGLRKFMIDTAGIQERADVYRKVFFEQFNNCFMAVSYYWSSSYFSIAREGSRLLGRDDKVDLKLGRKIEVLEELRMTVCAIVSLIDNVKIMNLSFVIGIVIVRIRWYLSPAFYNNHAYQAQVRECQALAVTLFESGILKVKEDRIFIEYSPESLKKWVAEIKKMFNELMIAYGNRIDPSGSVDSLADKFLKQEVYQPLVNLLTT
ncbi:MAG TPA: hypothetical protein PKN62_00865, partial [bacterium]|nr:hypothetical protein [bacterium]